MTADDELARVVPSHLIEMVRQWNANEYAIHKRGPFRPHSFDRDGRYWVVGTSTVSVLHGAHEPKEWAEKAADMLNAADALARHEHRPSEQAASCNTESTTND